MTDREAIIAAITYFTEDPDRCDMEGREGEVADEVLRRLAEVSRRPSVGSDHCDLLDTAWGVIANAGMSFGGWDHESPEWIDAAERWRDRWHEVLRTHCARRSNAVTE